MNPGPPVDGDALPVAGGGTRADNGAGPGGGFGPMAPAAEPATWAGESGLEPLPVRVDLPTGDTLVEAMLQLADNWRELSFPGDAAPYVDKGPGGTVTALAATDRGKLDGSLVVLNANGRMTAMASYTRGSRAGPLRVWDEDHRRALYCDFARNERDGLTCLFRGGEPWLVERWKKGILRESYLIRREGDHYRAVASGDLGAAAGQLRQAQERLETLVAQFSDQETTLMAAVAADYQAISDRSQRQRPQEDPIAAERDQTWRNILASCW